MLVYLQVLTKQTDTNRPTQSSENYRTGRISQVAISWSDANTVDPELTDCRLFQSVQENKDEDIMIHLSWSADFGHRQILQD